MVRNKRIKRRKSANAALRRAIQYEFVRIKSGETGVRLLYSYGNRGVSFLAEQIAGWPFDSEQDAICAAEKFNEVAVSANLEDKTEFLFTTEVVEDRSGGWRVHIEQSNGGGWTPVVSDLH
jgi:hypothetical protein